MTRALPIDFSSIDLPASVVALLQDEKAEFEAVLGRPVEFRPAAPGETAWRIEPFPTAARRRPVPALRRSTDGGLVSVASTPDEVLASINLLHTLMRGSDASAASEPASTVWEAAERIRAEIANTFPSFPLRGLDWDGISARHLAAHPGDDARTDQFVSFASSWVADLGDAHTTIRHAAAGRSNPPYRAALEDGGARLLTVPGDSAAHAAGVRSGWFVEIDDVGHWRRTVGATPQQRTQVQARRALAFNGTRRFRAVSPDGARSAEWDETAPSEASEPLVTRTGNDVTVVLRAFDPRIDMHGLLDDIIEASVPDDRLTLDLRGNTGGSIRMATELRDRFLRRRTRIGSVAFSDGRGSLAPRQERWAEPSGRPRWRGALRILVDEMTYSASEDFVLGLQGLDHVAVEGRRTGGGSGRARRIPVLDGVDLLVSTAITYDRDGHPVEHRGIVPDREL